MKKITVFLTALLLSMAGAYASGESDKESVRTVSLSGQVIDVATGEALAGVKVEVDGAGGVTYTDFEGNFAFEGLIPGSYCVNTSLISYQKGEKQVDVDHSGRIQVRLEQIKE